MVKRKNILHVSLLAIQNILHILLLLTLVKFLWMISQRPRRRNISKIQHTQQELSNQSLSTGISEEGEAKIIDKQSFLVATKLFV